MEVVLPDQMPICVHPLMQYTFSSGHIFIILVIVRSIVCEWVINGGADCMRLVQAGLSQDRSVCG